MDSEDYTWSPLTLSEIERIFHNLTIPWWVAGGVALDLFIGYQIRPHEDIDVAIFRDDQFIIQRHLSVWELYKTNQPGLAPWLEGEYLPLGVNQIWCRRTQDSLWSLEVMFMEREGEEWFFRREPRIRGAINGLIHRTKDGLPFLSPEIQLLFKARAENAYKDALDFHTVLPHLDPSQIRWLCSSLKLIFPTGHPWINIMKQSVVCD